MRSHKICLALYLAAFSTPGAAETENADDESTAEAPLVLVTEDGLTLEAAAVPLAAVLRAVAKEYGIAINLEGRLDTPVTLSLRNVCLKNALRLLATDAAFMIVHEPGASPCPSARPSEIWIYAAPVGTRPTLAHAATEGKQEARILEGPESDEPSAPAEEAPQGATQSEIEAMAENRTLDDLETLGQVVTTHPEADMRYLAATLLGDIPDRNAVLAIERGFGDQDAMFRSYLVETLGKNDALDAVRSLGGVLFGEADPTIRLTAVQNLATRNEEPASDFLRAATEDANPAVRRAAAMALESMR